MFQSEEIDVKILPPYLQEDIEFLQESKKTGDLLDCALSNLLASINASEVCRDITPQMAKMLRKKYIG